MTRSLHRRSDTPERLTEARDPDRWIGGSTVPPGGWGDRSAQHQKAAASVCVVVGELCGAEDVLVAGVDGPAVVAPVVAGW